MLDGIRTRNPQIRSLMRYPLRHEHGCKAFRAYSNMAPACRPLTRWSDWWPPPFGVALCVKPGQKADQQKVYFDN